MRSSSFIEIYDNSFNKKECELIISQFEKSEQVRGQTADGYQPEVKNCYELPGNNFKNGSIISNIVRPVLDSYLDKYGEKYGQIRDYIRPWSVDNDYSVQKYETEDDGYKKWHCESGGGWTSKRMLAWMFYLNNAKCGTEFMNFPTIRAKMGRCVIWPSGWTHHHRGVLPNKGLKYIVTGWCSFREDN